MKIFRQLLLRDLPPVAKKYPNEEHKYHNTLIINERVYPGYDGYGIHQGTDNSSTAKKLQRKATTTMESEELDILRRDLPLLHGII